MKVVPALIAAASLAALSSPSAHALCAYSSPRQQFRSAQLVLIAVSLEGPTASGIQRFGVIRYLKGHRRWLVRIQTGFAQGADGGWVSGEGIHVRSAGERWRIYANRGKNGVLYTSICAGSRRIG